MIPGKTRSIIRLLMAIHQFNLENGRDPYTRELLRLLGTWGYGEVLLHFLEDRGLVERYRGRCSPRTRRRCLFNRLTDKGIEYLEHAELIMTV